MSKKVEDVNEGLDFSGLSLSEGDEMSDEGLGFGNALEVDSIEDIGAQLDDINKHRTPNKPEDGEEEKPKKDKTPKSEDEEEPEADEERVDDKDKKPEDGEQSPLKIFAEFLGEKDIIDFDPETFEDNEEYLVSKIDERIKKGIEEYKESFSPEAKEILDAIESGIPASTILQHNSAIETYESLTDEEIETNESLQKSLIRNLYTMNGYNKEVIEKKIKRLDDAGLLADEAKDAKLELVEAVKAQKEELKEQQKADEQDRIQKFEDWKTGIKKTLDSKDEIIPGFKMTPAQKKLVQEGMTKFDRDGKNELQRRMAKDPEFNIKVAYMALALNWDFSKFDKQAMTKATSALRDSIANSNKMKGSGLGDGVNRPSSSVNYELIAKTLKSKA